METKQNKTRELDQPLGKDKSGASFFVQRKGKEKERMIINDVLLLLLLLLLFLRKR